MIKYSEKTVTSYTRAETISIRNLLNNPPMIQFNEEEVIVTPEGTEHPTGFAGVHVNEVLYDTNIGEEFNLIDENGDVSGTATYGQFQQMLYSLYLHVAAKRDATGANSLPQPQPLGLTPIPPATP